MIKGGCKRKKRGTRALTFNWKDKTIVKSKHSQVTIFIIIAVLVIVAAVLMYFLYPKIRTSTTSSSPTIFIQSCIEDELQKITEKVSLQGGSINPELYIKSQGENIEYLCYTNEYYKKCVVQEPSLKSHIESEIKEAIKTKVQSCFNSVEEDYKKKGYQVSLTRKDYEIEIQPKKVIVNFDYELTLNKGTSAKYDNFRVSISNNLYNLLIISNRIIEWETQYGDSDITSYMNYYPWLKAEKIRKTDGTKIYILTDRNSEDKFQFASRSVVIAPGYQS